LVTLDDLFQLSETAGDTAGTPMHAGVNAIRPLLYRPRSLNLGDFDQDTLIITRLVNFDGEALLGDRVTAQPPTQQ
jgi:hypothetical protein